MFSSTLHFNLRILPGKRYIGYVKYVEKVMKEQLKIYKNNLM